MSLLFLPCKKKYAFRRQIQLDGIARGKGSLQIKKERRAAVTGNLNPVAVPLEYHVLDFTLYNILIREIAG